MSSASSSLCATTAATSSPMKRTTPSASTGCADRLVVELVQHRRDLLHALEIGSRDHHGAVRCARRSRSFPAATGLRTKRTQWAAGRSAVKRPCPVIKAGSSSRRIARPTQVMPEPRVPCALTMCCSPARGERRRARDRADIPHWSDGLPKDRWPWRRLQRLHGRLCRPGAWPLRTASASAIRRGEGSAPPSPTRASVILPPCKR